MSQKSQHGQSLRELLSRMSLDELREGQRLLLAELDRREGRAKFQPIQAWPHLYTRDAR